MLQIGICGSFKLFHRSICLSQIDPVLEGYTTLGNHIDDKCSSKDINHSPLHNTPAGTAVFLLGNPVPQDQHCCRYSSCHCCHSHICSVFTEKAPAISVKTYPDKYRLCHSHCRDIGFFPCKKSVPGPGGSHQHKRKKHKSITVGTFRKGIIGNTANRQKHQDQHKQRTAIYCFFYPLVLIFAEQDQELHCKENCQHRAEHHRILIIIKVTVEFFVSQFLKVLEVTGKQPGNKTCIIFFTVGGKTVPDNGRYSRIFPKP